MDKEELLLKLQKDIEYLKDEHGRYLSLQRRVNRVFFDSDKHIMELYEHLFHYYFTIYVAGGMVRKEGNNYVLTMNNIKLCLQTDPDLIGRMFFVIINEIIIQKNYDRFDDSKDFVFVDLGSNVMITSLYMANKPTCKAVYSFEPLEFTYNKGLQNIELASANVKNKINSYNIGVSDKDENVEITFCKKDTVFSTISKDLVDQKPSINNSYINDVYEKANLNIKKASSQLEPIIAKHKSENLVLKIDTEGCEVQILRSMLEANQIKYFSTLLFEYHSHVDKKTIINILEKEGYNIVAIDDINGEVGNIVASK